MRKRELYDVCLNLFDEGGAAAEGAPQPSGGSTLPGAKNPSAAGKGRAKSALADVKYGKQASTSPVSVESTDPGDPQAAAGEKETETVTSDPLADRKAKFDELINGEFKDEFSSRTQKIINERFKQVKQLESEYEKVQPLIDLLGTRYGIQDGKVESIVKAVQEDDAFYEQAAMERGMSVDQYKYMLRMEAENRALRKTREEMERRKNADAVYAGWMQEAESVKSLYPGFDMQAELGNPEFTKLLGAGVGVKAAFQALHHDEIMAGAMQYTAQTIKKKTADNIASRQQRPSENGLGAQAGVSVKSDVSKLTRADRAEIARRAARGENIAF